VYRMFETAAGMLSEGNLIHPRCSPAGLWLILSLAIRWVFFYDFLNRFFNFDSCRHGYGISNENRMDPDL